MAEELLEKMLAISVYKFLEKVDQENKRLLINKNLRREQDGGTLSTFNISYNILVSKTFFSLYLALYC